MYVCVCVYESIYVYVCMYVCMYVCIHIYQQRLEDGFGEMCLRQGCITIEGLCVCMCVLHYVNAYVCMYVMYRFHEIYIFIYM